MSETLTLRFVRTDAGLQLRASNRPLACYERFEGLDGERVSCTREGETQQVLVKASGDFVVAVRDMDGQRGYYGCTPSGDVDGLPALMSCRRTSITPRGTGGLSSPFDSTVAGLDVPNSHWVDEDALVLRGMEPRTVEQYDDLHALGIERVVIFKNSTSTSNVDEEIAAWQLPEGDVLHVPFQWKGLGGFQPPCEQSLDALRFMAESEAQGRKVFFHCTVGEDRTGLLAALYMQLYYGEDARRAFDLDMCERGYSSGNPQKPYYVTSALARELTPFYRAISYLIAEGTLTTELDPAVCATEPTVPADFLADPLACGVSTTLMP